MNRPVDHKATEQSDKPCEPGSRNQRMTSIIYLLTGTAVVIASVGLALYAGSVRASAPIIESAPLAAWSYLSLLVVVAAALMAAVMTSLRADAIRIQPAQSESGADGTSAVTTIEQPLEPARPEREPVPEIMEFDTFRAELCEHWRKCRNQSTPLALVMAKIDNFRELADIFGHSVLARKAEQMTISLESLVRANGGQLARHRRGEVVAVLPNLSPDHALDVATDIRASVEDLGFEIPAADRGVMTVSVGLSVVVPSDHTRPDQLCDSARCALERARVRGGNRLEFEMPENRKLQSIR